MILVFAGAGASFAIDCEKYPTTAEFFSRVPSAIKNNPWFREASYFLRSIDNDNPIDIEQVLGALSELQEYCNRSLDLRSFPGWVLAPGQNRFSRLAEISEDGAIEYDPYAYLDEIVESMKKIIRSLEELEDDINTLVYELYAGLPSREALETWIMLLQLLARYDLHTEIFTTNYDLVIENAIRAGGLRESLGTGRVTDEINIMIDPAKWQTPLEDPITLYGPGLLTKLHGSVDWQQGLDGRIIVGGSRFTGEHQNHILIYPGFKGEPKDEPFVSFHNRLRLVAERAKAAIFIGYAFRDGFVNEILSNIPTSTPKFVINMEQSVPDLDFLRDSTHFGDGFTEESVTAFIALLIRHGLITVE